MTQIKDYLLTITLLITIYAGLSKGNTIPYWISGALLFGFFSFYIIIPWFKKRLKTGRDEIAIKKNTSLLRLKVGELKDLFEQYRKIIADQGWAYSFLQVLRSTGPTNNAVNNAINGRFHESGYGDMFATLIRLSDSSGKPELMIIEMGNCFTRANSLIASLWRDVQPETKATDTARQFVQRYNLCGAKIEDLFNTLAQTDFGVLDGVTVRYSIHVGFTHL